VCGSRLGPRPHCVQPTRAPTTVPTGLKALFDLRARARSLIEFCRRSSLAKKSREGERPLISGEKGRRAALNFRAAADALGDLRGVPGEEGRLPQTCGHRRRWLSGSVLPPPPLSQLGYANSPSLGFAFLPF